MQSEDLIAEIDFVPVNDGAPALPYSGSAYYYHRYDALPTLPGFRVLTNALQVYIPLPGMGTGTGLYQKLANGQFTRIAVITNRYSFDDVTSFYDQYIVLTPKQVGALLTGDLYTKADLGTNHYLGQIIPHFDSATGPVPKITLASPVFELYPLRNYFVVAPNSEYVTVTLDASGTVDPFYLPLSYEWSEFDYESNQQGAILPGNSSKISIQLMVGTPFIAQLSVNDPISKPSLTYIQVQALSPGDALTWERDRRVIGNADLNVALQQQLVAILNRAIDNFDQGNMRGGVSNLQLFRRVLQSAHLNTYQTGNVLDYVLKVLAAVDRRP
ncbi:MAG TPA: hypothetical protein VF607_10470 [Verrucomicrobiae bacterium]